MHNLLDGNNKKIYALTITDYLYITIDKQKKCVLYELNIPLTLQVLIEKGYEKKITEYQSQILYENCLTTLVETAIKLGLVSYRNTMKFERFQLDEILNKYNLISY